MVLQTHVVLQLKITSFVCCLYFLFPSQGLKKLGQSIESSYSSIQKLVISHLQRYSQIFTSPQCCLHPHCVSHVNSLSLLFARCSGSEALLYHLSEVKGMSLWKQKFEPLGLDSAAIEGTISPTCMISRKSAFHYQEPHVLCFQVLSPQWVPFL